MTNNTILNKAGKIKLVIFDIDGVLTDGKLYFSAEGDALKAFNAKDGLGIKMLLQQGIEVAFITGRQSPIVSQRAKELGVQHLYQGQLNKLEAYASCKKTLSLTDEQIAYMGDDIIDLPVMKCVGLPIAPANAFDYVQKQALYTCQQNGGDGAGREACDFILRAQNKWQAAIEHYGN